MDKVTTVLALLAMAMVSGCSAPVIVMGCEADGTCVVPADAAVPSDDASIVWPEDDAAMVDPDAGQVEEPDAWVAPEEPDASTPAVDAGSPVVDSGPAPVCGGELEQCCGGRDGTCDSGFHCADRVCLADCGGDGQECCTRLSQPTPCDSGLGCGFFSGRNQCNECGYPGGPCCGSEPPYSCFAGPGAPAGYARTCAADGRCR